jgi:hypothetical protein
MKHFSYFKSLLLLLLVCVATNANAQLLGPPNFNCKRDKLHGGTVRPTPDPSNLLLGQKCEVVVINSRGNNVSAKGFRVSSDNRSVRTDGLSFSIDKNEAGSPWQYLDGRLIEMDGTITVTHHECGQTHNFPFQVRQSYVFEKEISCKGERREFAIAPYRNTLGKELLAVMDMTRNQLYLMEAPITIDASGINGRNGAPGSPGSAGSNGTSRSHNGGRGGDGGHGANGEDGGEGGDITIYLSNHTRGVTVNVRAGEGGRGGAAGRGGSGGIGYSEGTGRNRVKLGQDGASGNSGRAGRDGQRGRDGYQRLIREDNIKKYFSNINQGSFDIENIIEN